MEPSFLFLFATAVATSVSAIILFWDKYTFKADVRAEDVYLINIRPGVPVTVCVNLRNR